MSMPMKELTSNMAGVCDELQSTNTNKIESIEMFIKCKDMVCWLQENIKSKYKYKEYVIIHFSILYLWSQTQKRLSKYVRSSGMAKQIENGACEF